jgi:methionyl aminopeptidase
VIHRKSKEDITIMQEGGRILVETLDRLEEATRPGTTTAQLDRIAEDAITSAGARPSFKGYRGFPGAICASPNDVIVHGIPGPRVLEEGDIFSVDIGVFYRGFHVDSAWTFPVGEIRSEVAELLKVTEQSLWAAVERCEPGARTGDVGYAVEEIAEAAGFSIVREYVGHGVGRDLHEGPQIPNYGPPGRGGGQTPRPGVGQGAR